MKKILLAIDAVHMDTDALHFACYMAALTRSTLTGVFLEQYEQRTPALKASYGMPYVETIVAADMPGYKERQEAEQDAIHRFRQTCAAKGIRCQVHLNGTHFPARTIIEESRFADLVIVSADTSFEKRFEGTPTNFVKDVLADAECAVMVAPLHFSRIDQVIFTYDGSRSSVFAIKQFTYLFPELADKKAIVLQVNKDLAIPLTEKEKIGELLKMHYSGIGHQVLQGKPADELFGYLLEQKNTMVVMGAYGRNWLSDLFKPSTAGALLKAICLPFFITHQ